MLESEQMFLCRKSGLGRLVRMAVTISVVLTLACRQRSGSAVSDAQVAGEPEQYAATVVRTVDDGKKNETVISREARSGDRRREEWTEGGKNRALIWRPDIGRAYLLDLDRRLYLEIDIGSAAIDRAIAGAGNLNAASNAARPAGLDAPDGAVQAIDKYFGDTQSPVRVETQQLPPASIEGHPCVVYQERAVFPDGHAETTRRFYARDLSGLLIRVESVAEQATVITERRDVRTEVAPDAFIVPDGYTKVEVLPR